MANNLHSTGTVSRELEVLELSVLFDNHFFDGKPTQIHFKTGGEMAGTWVDEHGTAHLSVGLDRIQFMSTEQLTFLIAHEYGHLVLQHPAKTTEIQEKYGVKSTLEYSKLMREMELQADLFGAKLVMGLGQNPVDAASFLLSETKSTQHPEGTLRVAKIKSEQNNLVPESFDTTLSSLPLLLRDSEIADSSTVDFNSLPTSNLTVKAAAEYWPDAGSSNPAVSLYGVDAAVLMTATILACALPSWWRKASMG
jgi:hypothetical protein